MGRRLSRLGLTKKLSCLSLLLSVASLPKMSTQKASKSSKDKDNSDKCGKCGKHVTENENAIQCEICDIWVHCQGISEEAYAVLKDMNNLHWYCDSCDVLDC